MRFYVKQFGRAGKGGRANITSSAPEYCQADANGNTRYNGKVFQQQGLGQQGGQIATGQ
jgi:hypothetical protein